MIGSFLTRGLVMVFGYVYPAYECYKTVEMNKPEIEQLRFWCQYWILVAVLTVLERVGDAFISWVPMYSEAKLAFFIYLWYPKTKGTTYVYDSFFRPYMAKHETEIDRNLLELRTWAGDMAVLYWQKAASYGQTRVFDILQYLASQSTPRSRPVQTKEGPRPRPAPPTAPNHQPSTLNYQQSALQPETEEPTSPTPNTSTQQKKVGPEDEGTSKAAEPAAPAPASNASKENIAAETSKQSIQKETEAMQIEAASSSTNDETSLPPKDILLEDTGRVTRARLRKTRSGNP